MSSAPRSLIWLAAAAGVAVLGTAGPLLTRAASAMEHGGTIAGPVRLADVAAAGPLWAAGALALFVAARWRAAWEDRRRCWESLRSAADGLLTVDGAGRIVTASARAAELLGYGEGELVGRHAEEVLPIGSTHAATQRLTGQRKGGETIPLDVRTGKPLPAEDGRLVTPVFLRDATQSRRTQEMLSAREAHLRLVVEQMPAILWTTDTRLKITSTRGAGLAAVNMRPEEVIGMSMLECLDNQDVDSTPIAAHLKAVAGESLTYEMEWKGRTFQVRVDPLRDPDRRIVGTVGILVDVTDRKLALAGLRARERQQAAVADLGLRALGGLGLPALMQQAADVVSRTLDVELVKVLEYRPEDRSFEVRAMTGWAARKAGAVGSDSQADFTLRTGAPVIVEDLKAEGRFRPSSSLLDRGAVSGISAAIRGKHGPLGVLAAHTAARRDFSQDDVNFLQGVANVVAAAIERRRAEEAQGRLVAILEATPDIVAIARQDRRLAYLNRAARELLGLRPGEDVSSRTMADLYPAELRGPALDERLRAAAARGVWSGEATLMGRDGRRVPVSQVVISHRPDGGGVEHYSAVARDLSERRSLEEQVRQAQKMEAIGKLAGGVAHDFNNLLCVINGYCSLIAAQVPPDGLLRTQVEEVRKAGERAASLTRQLLAFSRKQMLAPQALSLNALVADMDRLLRRMIGEDVTLATDLCPDVWPVRADKGQLEQVLMNLAVNARDAMPTGGRLTLSTANVTLGDGPRGRPEVSPGAYVVLTAADTGCGMTAEVMARVFEPFFTTKPVGEGTGLGLSTVYGIVKQSGGHIEVESGPGRGTTFRVYLPRLEEEPAADEEAKADPPGGRETVLLVEDEDGVRSLAGTVLRGKGYRVLEARDGVEALGVCERHPGRIDLVLSDAVMPNLSGGELARRLRPMRPEAKVLFMSGFTDSALVRHGIATGAAQCLLKPFAPEDLASAVRAALDGREP